MRSLGWCSGVRSRFALLHYLVSLTDILSSKRLVVDVSMCVVHLEMHWQQLEIILHNIHDLS
jgi:hypothetical protein